MNAGSTNDSWPSLLTGTSTEFLGRRALPKVVRERPVICILGPEGSGKTSVACQVLGGRVTAVDTAALHEEILRRVRNGTWSPALLHPTHLVLDGPVWLGSRGGTLAMLAELLRERCRQRRRTALCQVDDDSSLHLLSGVLSAGTVVTIGLRFPRSRRARRRFSRRVCVRLGLPVEAARGAEHLEPWTYRAVFAYLAQRHGVSSPAEPSIARTSGSAETLST